ncbi:DUF3618 domain-containing protein [Streptomyces albus]|uniref:DUF3618 domain-containing protein n=1 Tax=Streptomyces albus TaxID=1888 RepID=A0A6C1C4C2_9ACTN|nr:MULTISPECIES: DUF3618 domain-containing protein [Streptomyces]EPD91097.1 GC-domain-containing protein sorting domain [Streptomyces sp. HPH0547]MDI6412824.1 DUF3618 domain-containing protein [Streptomyces albus]QID36995.1 DUF3618 domain-containing protein [Streptomyces albus]TGG88097.1 DUF3618 domain-containing protein [Streptomyces albus]UVN56081.1 DUF3618 domain-containing protein [Streptomyces albus]
MTDHAKSHTSTPGPEELRAQVEETRRELGETVEALAARADVKTQARNKATRLKKEARAKAAAAKEQVSGSAHTVSEKVQERTPEQAQAKAKHAAETTRGNPAVPVAAGAAVLALILLARRRRRH